MNTIIYTDSEGRKYQLVNDTAYKLSTPDKVVTILEESRQNKTRLIFDYGDKTTGKSWGETFDICGHVGRSTGTCKIPLLIKTARSYGGGAISDDCIVKITTAKGKRVLYQHPNYKPVNEKEG